MAMIKHGPTCAICSREAHTPPPPTLLCCRPTRRCIEPVRSVPCGALRHANVCCSTDGRA